MPIETAKTGCFRDKKAKTDKNNKKGSDKRNKKRREASKRLGAGGG
jgi:hypothetical protein